MSTWPNVGRKLGVDLSSVSTQLPTVVAFEKGAEVARVPASRTGGSSSSSGRAADVVWTLRNKRDLVQGLKLEAKLGRAQQAAGRASNVAAK
jgi:hypothetical protein